MRIPFLLLACIGLFVGCAGGDESVPRPGTSDISATDSPFGISPPSDSSGSGLAEGSETLRPGGAEGPSGAIRVVFMGTSLTEGLGLIRPEIEAWPARVGELADSAGIHLVVVNAGLSGETSAGALRRVDWVLRQTPDVLVVETGANDGLRGIPIAEVERNLDGILTRVAERSPSTRIILVAMEAPTNLGAEYTGAFRELFRNAAARHRAAVTPFLLEGVAGIREMNQSDQIHPTAEGHRRMARNVWGVLDSIFTLSAPRAQ